MGARLGNYDEPYLNGATLKRLYSAVVKDNIFQELFTRVGEACEEKYVEDTSVAQVTVLRVLPGDGSARSIGSDIDGGFFPSGDPMQNKTVAYHINLLDIVDYQVDIPEVQQDMMATDLVATRAKILGGQVATAVNALTIAAYLVKNFNDIHDGKIDKNWYEFAETPAAGDYLEAIIEAGSYLDNGNIDEGIQTYPKEVRALFIRPRFKAELLKRGQLIIGGSNIGQKIIETGGLSEGVRADNVSGFCGIVDNTPCYLLSDPILKEVARYLGLFPTDLDLLYGVLVSGIGTGRGLAFNQTIKQIDSPDGAGIRMQPIYRFGAECWDGLSVVPIVKHGFVNPSDGSLAVVAPRSRKFKVVFDKNGGGGTGPAAIENIVFGGHATLPDNTFTAPSGKAFKGWALRAGTPADKALAVGTSVKVTINTKYYAIWG